MALTLASAAVAEERQPSQPPAGESSGPFGAIGRLFGDVFNGVTGDLKSMTGRVGDLGGKATDAAKDAAGTVARIPATRVVAGRQKCERAPNGGPDCQAAAEALCRAKGLAGGRSLDIQSAQSCPAQVWLSAREPQPGECATDSFVTRAVCQ